MNRVQKKCLIASTGLHGLLLLVVLFGSAFFTAKDKVEKSPPVEFITLDAKLIDGLTSGGGNPKVKPVPPAPPSPAVVKTEAVSPPPKPQAEPVKPVKLEPVPPKRSKPEPVKEPVIKDHQGFEPIIKKEKKKNEIKVDTTKVIVRNDTDAKSRAEAAKKKAQHEKEAREYANAQHQARLDREAQFKGALTNLKNNLTTGTDIEPFGPGGEAFVDYSQFVKNKYDEAWIAPGEGADDSATVQVKVTIARAGQVISAEIVKRSGSAMMDNSIDRVLKRVRFVAPFPEGAKDAERTFVINFNLKAKRLSG